METGQIGHLSFKLNQVHQGIYLVGQQDRLLLVHTGLAGTHLDEEVAALDGCSCIAHVRTVVVIIVHTGSTAMVLALS